MALTKKDAYRRIRQLRVSLEAIVAQDSEQEVEAFALPVIDAAFETARQFLEPDDPLVAVSTDVVTVDMVAMGEPLRAVEALLVAGQLEQALHVPPRAAFF